MASMPDALEAARERLDRLWARGTEFLGCPYAIMGGAMSWVSEKTLVSAISNAGGFGVIACGSMTPDLLAAEIAGTQAMTTKPFKRGCRCCCPRIPLAVPIDNASGEIDVKPAA